MEPAYSTMGSGRRMLSPCPAPCSQGRGLVLCTSLLSLLLSLAVLLPSLLLLVNGASWQQLDRAVEGWLERHPWDRKVMVEGVLK